MGVASRLLDQKASRRDELPHFAIRNCAELMRFIVL